MSQAETFADGLLAQHKLLVAVIHTDWATRLDHKVAAVIIERYMRKQGNSRASLRYLEKATGSLRNKIIPSTRRLVEHGVFHVVREGVGTRPTEYGLNFGFSASGAPEGTTTENHSSGALEGTPSGAQEGTANLARGAPEGTESSLTVPGLQAGVQERENECASPSAPPPPPANAADGAGSAQDGTKAAKSGFEELWDAYGYKRGKPEARRAYAKLAPDADLHAVMVASAIEWQRTWAAQDKPDAPRFTLTKWIEREEYECEPPTAYKPKQKKPAAANDDKPAARGKGRLTEPLRLIETEFIGSPFSDYKMRIKLDGPSGDQEHILHILTDAGPGPDNDVFNKMQRAFGSDADEWPSQRLRLEVAGDRILDLVPERKPDRLVEIRETVLVEVDGDTIMVVKFQDALKRPEGQMDIVLSSNDCDSQAQGQRQLSALCTATGLRELSDEFELHGRSLVIKASGKLEPVPEAA